MKTIYLFFFCFNSYIAFGQVDGFEFKPSDLKEYLQIEVIQTNHYTDSTSIFESLLSINSDGLIYRKEFFDAHGKPHYYVVNTFNDQNQLITRTAYSEVFTYNNAAGEHLPVWDEGYNSGSEYEYVDGKVSKELYFNTADNEKSYSSQKTLIYDEKHRLNRIEYLNLYIGFTGTFPSNSSELDSIFYKEEVSTETEFIEYRGDSVVSTRKDDGGDILGYIFEIWENDVLIEFHHANADGFVYLKFKYKYDENGRRIEGVREIIDVSEIDFDYVAADTTRIEYGENDLPVKTQSFSDGELISVRTFKYIK